MEYTLPLTDSDNVGVDATDIILDHDEVEEVTEANLRQKFLDLTHYVETQLEYVEKWVATHSPTTPVPAEIRKTIKDLEEAVVELKAFETIMRYMGYDIPTLTEKYSCHHYGCTNNETCCQYGDSDPGDEDNYQGYEY